MGIESGDEWIRREIYRKNFSNSQVKKIVNLCKKYGIHTLLYFMLGGPGETLKTMENTLKFAKSLNTKVTFHIFKPLPKSEAEKQIKNLGGYVDEKRLERQIISFLMHQ